MASSYTPPSDIPLSARRDPGPNVIGPEKWGSIALGGLIAAAGIAKRGPAGVLLTAIGGGLIARGVTGHDPIKRNVLPTGTEKALAKEHGWTFAAPINRATAVNKPRDEVYAFFRDVKNLASFMDNIERIDVIDDTRSHWVVKAPAGKTVEWDSTITEDVPGERFVYKTEEGADIDSVGTVTFKDGAGGKGTQVHVAIVFSPPAGKIGRAFAALFMKDPAIQLRQDLVRFKMLMETGEIATSKSPDAAPRDQSAGFLNHT